MTTRRVSNNVVACVAVAIVSNWSPGVVMRGQTAISVQGAGSGVTTAAPSIRLTAEFLR